MSHMFFNDPFRACGKISELFGVILKLKLAELYLLCESHEFRFEVVGDMSVCFWRFMGRGGGGSGGGGSGLHKVYGEHCITLVKLE